MPVDTIHDDYEAAKTDWEKARDVIAGERKIKERGVIYLPMLGGQSEAEYDSYKERASFFNATGRTLDGMVGEVFRKPPVITAPEGTSGPVERLDRALNDTDLNGNRFDEYARAVLFEVMSVARAVTLVDWSEEEERPFTSLYRAEDVLNWKVERVGGRNRLVLVVLREMAKPHESDASDVDEFAPELVEQLRVLRLQRLSEDPEDEDGMKVPEDGMGYTVELFQMKRARKGTKAKKLEWTSIHQEIPMRVNVAIPDIPVVFHGPKGTGVEVQKLPLCDLIAVNLSHWRMDADWKHGLHFTALPTAWVAGFPADTVLKIGSTTAWVSSDPSANAGYLEFQGQGLDAIKDALERDEKLMAILGARLLETQKREAETAEAMRMRQSGEGSILGSAALAVSKGCTKVLKWFHWWLNTTADHPDNIDSEDVSILLNTDFDSQRLTPREVVDLVAAWQSQGFSRDTLHFNLERGEFLPPGRTKDEEKEAIDAEVEAAGGSLGNTAPEPLDEPPDGE